MNREKLGNCILTITTIVALVFAIGGVVLAVMCPIPAHATGVMFVGKVPIVIASPPMHRAAPQTALPEASAPSGVATYQAPVPTCLKGCDSKDPPGFGWFLSIIFLFFLFPMTTYFFWWCFFRSDK